MNAKGFLLLVITVVVIGGSVGGAFAGGLALGRSQNDHTASESALLQQLPGGFQLPSGVSASDLQERLSQRGGFQGGQFGGATGGPGLIVEDGPVAGEDAQTRFGGGDIGGRGGFGGVLIGTVGTVDGNSFTVNTETGETAVNLGDDSTITRFETGTANDLSPGDRVVVVTSGDVESGELVEVTSVIINPPEGGGILGGGGFGGRPQRP